MSQPKTTIVIGAGASSEVNLPTGEKLKKIIASTLNISFDKYSYSQKGGSTEINNALRSISEKEGTKNTREYIHACWKIRDAMPQAPSIDNFIDVHRGDKKIEICGKLAIAESILKAEKSSEIYINSRNENKKINFNNVSDTWFNSFLQLVTENCSKEDLINRLSNITLIIFNYDRCIEHFIYHWLQNYYTMDESEAKELVTSINIYHPYGSLGNLPWQGNNPVGFGANVHSSTLLEIFPKIKTFTEGTDPASSSIIEIRQSIESCDRLLFLGFSYQKQNLNLLKPEKSVKPRKRYIKCFGTSIGISNSNKEIIRSELGHFRNLLQQDIHLTDIECSKIFHEYSRNLSLS